MNSKYLSLLLAISSAGFGANLVAYRNGADIPQDAMTRATKLGASPASVRTDIVEIDKSQILNQQTLVVNLPNNLNVTAVRDRFSKENDGSTVWVGKVTSGIGRLTLVERKGSIAGSLSVGKRLFSISPISSSLQALQEINTAKLPPEEPAAMEAPGSGTHDVPAGSSSTLGVETPVLDVLVAYSKQVASSVSDVQTLAQLAIQESNTGFINSNVKVRFRLAGLSAIQYDETNKSWETIMSNLVDRKDGVIDNIVVARNAHGADIVAMLVENSTYCGQAAGIETSPEDAYVVVNRSCATGYYSFAHEVGHVLGVRHNIERDPTLTPFADGHGYQYNVGGVGQWRTIMSYDCPGGCPRLDYWSNPDIKYNNVSMGNTTHANNARVLSAQAQKFSWARARKGAAKLMSAD